jgi:hypothetical protein
MVFHFRRKRLGKNAYHVVKQEKKTSCGQACIAMLTGLSHDAVLHLYEKNIRQENIKRRLRHFSREYYTSANEQIKLLTNIIGENSCKKKKFVNWKKLCESECRMILSIRYVGSKYVSKTNHAVVFVNKKNDDEKLEAKIIDPIDGRIIKFNKHNSRPLRRMIVFRCLQVNF